MLSSIRRLLLTIRIARDLHGQDLIEYALLAGLLATAGAAVLPEVSDSVWLVFRRVNRVLNGRHIHHSDD